MGEFQNGTVATQYAHRTVMKLHTFNLAEYAKKSNQIEFVGRHSFCAVVDYSSHPATVNKMRSVKYPGSVPSRRSSNATRIANSFVQRYPPHVLEDGGRRASAPNNIAATQPIANSTVAADRFVHHRNRQNEENLVMDMQQFIAMQATEISQYKVENHILRQELQRLQLQHLKCNGGAFDVSAYHGQPLTKQE